jgi:hypothetical protein
MADRNYTLSDFDYALPPELIAQHPAAERSGSRLLDGRRLPPVDRVFRELPALLDARDLLVFNDTRVIKARLFGNKDSGGSVELLVERLLPGTQEVWAHLRASKSPKPGSRIRQARRRGRTDRLAAFRCGPAGAAALSAGERHLARRRRHLPAGAQREPRRAQDAQRMLRAAAGHRGCRGRLPRARWARGGGGHHQPAGARIRRPRRHPAGRRGRDRALHPSGLSVSGGRRARHQLPPAQEHADDAGQRLRRLRAHPARARHSPAGRPAPV